MHRRRHTPQYLSPTFTSRTRAELQRALSGSASTYVEHSGARRTAGAVVMAMTESDKYTLPDPQFEHPAIYPKWWGHREFCADPEDARGRARERWACPRRMVDETTQTAGGGSLPAVGDRASSKPAVSSALVRYHGDDNGPSADTAKDAPATQPVSAKGAQPERHEAAAMQPVRQDQGTSTPHDSPRPPDPSQPRTTMPKTTTSSAKSTRRNNNPPERTGAPPHASVAQPTHHRPPQKRASPLRRPIEISPPRHPNHPHPPTLFDIATAFLDSDVMSRLDLSVLQDLDEDSGGGGDGGDGGVYEKGAGARWQDLPAVITASG
ncbi:hypothetical protein HDU87_004471 [Geranomyces variabilis]|uniref:Uncharacterized protein n=1 Tax=Geranomyces variabilis TaxID=109894 RepID=A0AAD5TIF2_9FUNG|nr:hypothetical protein HDU87_004471 [Geranomyces variabilis]